MKTFAFTTYHHYGRESWVDSDFNGVIKTRNKTVAKDLILKHIQEVLEDQEEEEDYCQDWDNQPTLPTPNIKFSEDLGNQAICGDNDLIITLIEIPGELKTNKIY